MLCLAVECTWHALAYMRTRSACARAARATKHLHAPPHTSTHLHTPPCMHARHGTARHGTARHGTARHACMHRYVEQLTRLYNEHKGGYANGRRPTDDGGGLKLS